MTNRKTFVGLLAAGLTVTLTIANAVAGQPINVLQIWARASVPGVAVGAAYFVVHNKNPEADVLLRIESPRSKIAEMHTSTMQGDLMKMEKLEALDVPGESSVVFKPGGHHVMLMELDEPLVEGSTFPMTLIFENAGPVEVTVAVQGIGAMEHTRTATP